MAGRVDQADLDRVYDRLDLLETSLFPDDPTLRVFVKKLQKDIMKIADSFLQNGYLMDAFNLYGAGLQINKYLTKADLNLALSKGFAECCFLRAKHVPLHDFESEAKWFSFGCAECQRALLLGIDPDDITMEILPVIYLFELVKKGDTIPPTQVFKIINLVEAIGSLSKEARSHSDILKIKEAVGIPDSPSTTEDETETDTSEICKTGATGGLSSTTSPEKKSKRVKKKKGKKKGRSRPTQLTDSPRTRGAKKKRSRKKYKTITVANDEDKESSDDASGSDEKDGDENKGDEEESADTSSSINQEGKDTSKGRKYKSGNIAELDDFVFDTLPKSSESDQSDSDVTSRMSVLPGTGISGVGSTDDYRQYIECSTSNQGGWETVVSRRSVQKTYTRCSSSQKAQTKSKSAPPPQRYLKKKKSKPGTPQRNAVSGTPQIAKTQDPNRGQRPMQFSCTQRKLTPRMKICLDRVLSSNRGSFTYLCDVCLCGACPQMIRKHDTANHCNSVKKHPWSVSKVMAYLPESKGKAPVRIRPRPKSFYGKAHMCWNVNSLCRQGDKCTHAHNKVEQQVWDIGNINHEEVVKHCTTKSQPIAATYCCTYCDRSFTRKSAFDDHINTEDHKSNITSDHDRPWKYREPPPNVINGSYTLCQSAVEGTCNFSNMDPSDNPCPKAHSEKELKEWQDRHSYRRMKMQKAKNQRLFSFMDDLLAEYNFSMTESEVMTELDPDDVQIQCKEDLTRHTDGDEHVKNQSKSNAIMWSFSIKASEEMQLKRVGLLHDTYRTHFYLSCPTNATKPQVCPGPVMRQQEGIYHINVKFESQMLGSFKQWVVFDFNKKPVVIRKLSVSIGGENIPATPPTATPALWDSANSRVIRYGRPDKASEELEAQYKLSQFTPDMKEVSLSSSTYKHFMHHVLWLEEKECMEKLASFKHETHMLITNVVVLDSLQASTLLPAQPGHLFGQIDITQPIFGDSAASQIALTRVRYVLLKFDSSSPVVYEAELVDNEKGGQTPDSIFVHLGPECVSKENLVEKIKTKTKIGLQFCVDRLHYCKMHRAVDRLTPDVVFPSRNEHPAMICPDPSDNSRNMNSRQLGAARFIESTWRPLKWLKTPEMLLVYGPFGTGKTHTLAYAVMQTLKTNLSSPYLQPRVLICTHSNAAADLYITDFFHDFVESKEHKGKVRLQRIVAQMRNQETIPPIVQKYVPFDQKDPSKPKTVSATDVKACHIVIATTTNAMQLAAIPELKGHFTHILIDEAGQVLETECIIPLALAGEGTCIVLAGDHLQTAPKVYSPLARKMNFHKSLLERLFEYSWQKKCRREVLLTANYRTCPEILTFLSKNFYTAAEIEACGNQPRHALWYPLEFRQVMGEDRIVGNSYINVYESQEIVKRVQQLIQYWPEDWGERFPEGIGVLTPYKQQVDLIRNQLRKSGLRDVFVNRLQAIQGKQFRVVIISTVRTRETINTQSSDTEDYLGFLSESRELNTALTRTRSLVVVVGDPYALCSVGECCNVWKRYIKECEVNSSLYGDVSYKDLQRATQKALNPQARSFVPAAGSRRRMPSALLRGGVGAVPGNASNYAISGDQSSSFNMESLAHELASLEGDQMTNQINEETSSEMYSSESEDEQLLNRDDIILRELHRQLSLDMRGEKDSVSDDEEKYPIKQSKGDLVMIDEEGHVRIGQEISRQQQVSVHPGETILCTFCIDREGIRYATPKESRKGFEEICISNNSHRGTALNGDEVIVEILENSDAISDEPAKVYGKVIKVETPLQSYLDKKLVCRADPFTDNLMAPLERHLPKIYVLRPKPPGSGKKTKAKASLMVRICRFRNGRARCIREVEVSPGDRPHKLFLVRWLKWERVPYALGMVTDELPDGDNHANGLMILKHIYGLSEDKGSRRSNKESAEYQTTLEKELRSKGRTDLRDQVIFTIDPPDSQDLDDALSIEEISNDKSVVGVHIADVSCFVRLDSDLDKSARARATSFYPSFTDPIHMLPTKLSTDICSLHPDQDKVTLSVFFTMDKMGSVDNRSVRIERSVITSSARLSYDEADDIILGKPSIASSEIKFRIQRLHALAAQRRKQRLKDERFLQSDVEATTSFRAHYLVEEMMLVANEQVAKYLIKAYPGCTPLRRQPYPEREKVQEWRDTHSRNIDMSGGLLHRQNQLQRQCGDLTNTDGSDPEMMHRRISITKDVWKNIVAANSEDFIRLAGIVCTDQNHPQLAPVRAALHRILQPAEYICSGTTAKHSHGSLDMEFYTHFTSPIRRYIDIVTHRQLIAAIAKKKVPPHSKEDVSSLCHTCNVQAFKAKEFELKARALDMAMQAMNQPIQTQAFIDNVSTKSFKVIFPPEILPALKYANVAYKLLKPIVSPEVNEEDKVVTMKWKESLYSLRGIQTLQASDIRSNQRRGIQHLDTHERLTHQIPAAQWKELQQAIAMDNVLSASRAVDSISQAVFSGEQQSQPIDTVQEVTCEMLTEDDNQVLRQYVNFQRPFAVGDVLAVQLHSRKDQGMMSPSVQLLNVTPTLDFCFEHRSDPVQCFTGVADRFPNRSDLRQYRRTWLPIIEMEAVYSSVSDNNTIIIQCLNIEWQPQQPQDRKSLPCGSFSLSRSFCEARHINCDEISTFKHAWLCLRYTELEVPRTDRNPKEILVAKKTPKHACYKTSKVTFVAHASIPDASMIKNKEDERKDRMTIFFEVNQTSTGTFPTKLTRPTRNESKEWTVEFIPYNYPSSRLRQAVESLSIDDTPDLIQNICLLRNPTEKTPNRLKDEEKVTKKDKLELKRKQTMAFLRDMARQRRNFIVPGSRFQPNHSQTGALKAALSGEFTLIQGPPGTGKTVSGANLVYFFSLQNQQLSDTGDIQPQILYCGPSNKSVDVITGYLKQFPLSIARVYSKNIETKEFPIPGVPKPSGKLDSRDVEMDPHHKAVSLHHLIRHRNNQYSQEILDYDERFSRPGYQATPKEVKTYTKLITKAEGAEIRNHQVILCTCNAAGSRRIKRSTNIIQCVVDEAGMCSEPETLIPLVATNPIQIVLIGDPKQLRPIIQEPTAKVLEMEISLLERYRVQMRMLTIQYRMALPQFNTLVSPLHMIKHRAICYFPSTAFYDDKLITPDPILRRPSPLLHPIWPSKLPIAFCHSTRPEETLSVRTAEGNEMSKANPQEAEHVVRIAVKLIQCGIKPSQIVILSQYRLQCARITERLQRCRQTAINVRTVIQSQGSEWDFVIISTVRSLPRVEIEERPNVGWRKKYLGFITDENQMNVALTRAKHGLIIVGNKWLLRTHKKWEELLNFYAANNCVVNASNFPPIGRARQMTPYAT